METKPQKIVRLEAQNMMRLRVVEITADGNLVVVGGRNKQGKSSVLNSIAMALGGEREVPAEPVHRGEEYGEIVLELDDLVVTRSFTAGKTSKLEVRAKEGYKIGTPQKILDSLIGGLKKMRLTFDPLEFVRADGKKQIEALKQIVTVDLDELEAMRQEHYEDRTETNREIKRLQGVLSSTPYHDDIPTKEISVADLIKERDRLAKENQDNQAERKRLINQKQWVEAKAIELKEARELVGKLENTVAIEEALAHKMEDAVEGLEDNELESLDESLAMAEKNNRKVRENAEHDHLNVMIAQQEKESKKLTEQINTVDEEKKKRIAETPFPVEGLGFGTSGLTFNDLPFEQASQAEQLRVAVAIGLATNPKLRVMLIRDGSLLDDDNLALIAKMADEAEAQLWIERVGEGEECTVVIEDGRVKDRKRTP